MKKHIGACFRNVIPLHRLYKLGQASLSTLGEFMVRVKFRKGRGRNLSQRMGIRSRAASEAWRKALSPLSLCWVPWSLISAPLGMSTFFFFNIFIEV